MGERSVQGQVFVGGFAGMNVDLCVYMYVCYVGGKISSETGLCGWFCRYEMVHMCVCVFVPM